MKKRSKSEVKRLFKQGGIKVNGITILKDQKLKIGDILQVGKKEIYKIIA